MTGKSKIFLIFDIVRSVFKHNISFKDYFCFRFFELGDNERTKWAGTGFMYEYQLKMNPKGSREILENKILFLNHFRTFVRRKYLALSDMRVNRESVKELLTNATGRIVLKNSHGQIGAEVEVIFCDQHSPESVIGYMETKNFNMAEEYVVQHPALMELSPTGLNTIRIFTQIHEGRIDIMGARLRISVNCPIDNMAAGNLAAPINVETGIVSGPGVYSDITKEEEVSHPITGKNITDFVIPHWRKVLNMVSEAANQMPENKSVGWDIAITSDGPELIEGNHNWCKLLWQLPVKRGLKSELEKYL